MLYASDSERRQCLQAKVCQTGIDEDDETTDPRWKVIHKW